MKEARKTKNRTIQVPHEIGDKLDKLKARISYEEEKVTFEVLLDRLIKHESERLDSKNKV